LKKLVDENYEKDRSMIDKILSLFFGTKHERDVKKLWPVVHKINALEPDMKKLSNDEMRAMTSKFRARIEKGESLESILPEAFALVREASVRTLGCATSTSSSWEASSSTREGSPR